jgi:predicted ATP-binding protein involved in virulence
MKFVSLNEHKFVISGKQKYKKMLPIALKSFHIKNYRGIIDTQIDNIPPDTQWIFLTGENGFGKTSILQGIASLLSINYFKPKGSISNYIPIHDSFATNLDTYVVKGEVKVYNNYNSDNEFYTLTFPFSIDSGSDMYAVFNSFVTSSTVAYGSSRLRVSAGSTKEVINKYSSFDTLFSNDVLLTDIEEKFKDWKSNYSEGFDALVDIFKILIPQLHKIKVEFDKIEKKSKVKYYEKDDNGKVYEKGTPFIDLATGYQNIIAMIGDMIIRLSNSQPLRKSKDLIGIVLIDEIDLHLHPKYQKLFVQKLTELFPKIQFIVSTHSPIPLLGAPKNSVIINVSRTREEGIKAELLDIDFSVLTPNAILSSPIFGFQDLIPESKSDDKMIRTEDTFQEVEFNDQLKKNINEFLTEDRQKELLDLLKIKAL